jgi:hypothetical protein
MSALPVAGAAPWRRTLVLQGHRRRRGWRQELLLGRRGFTSLAAACASIADVKRVAWYKNGTLTHNKNNGIYQKEPWKSFIPCGSICLRAGESIFLWRGSCLETWAPNWSRSILLFIECAPGTLSAAFACLHHASHTLFRGVLFSNEFHVVAATASDPAAPTLTRKLSTGQLFRSNSDTFVYTWCLFLT